MSRKIRVIIAEDHALVRKGLVLLLGQDTKIIVSGNVANGRELLDLLKYTDTDIILLDLEMPLMNGSEALSILQTRYPKIKVIIVSLHYSPGLISEYLRKGASGYLFKNVDPEILLDAIHSVFETGKYFDYATSNALLNRLQNESPALSQLSQKSLSLREVEILKLLCEHKTAKQIAFHLKISARTVVFHRQNIYRKTSCKRTTELVMFALKQGIMKNENNPFDN